MHAMGLEPERISFGSEHGSLNMKSNMKDWLNRQINHSEEWVSENPARGIVAALIINAVFWGLIILFMQ